MRSAFAASVRPVSLGSAPRRDRRERPGRESEDRLPERAGVDGQLGADLEDLERGVGTEDVVDDDHHGAVHDPHADGGAVRCARRSACTIERARSSFRSR